jgi:anti-anti-sigma factor
VHVKVETENGIKVVTLSGSLDAMTSSKLEGVIGDLLDKGTTELILDLNDVSYISSAGLRVILQAAQQLYQKGRIFVTRPQSQVREILEMTGLDTVVPIHDKLETAREAMRSQ